VLNEIRKFVSTQGRTRLFLQPQNRLHSLPVLLSDGYRRLVHCRFSDRGVNTIVNLVLEVRLSRRGATLPPLLSVHDVVFEHRQNFILRGFCDRGNKVTGSVESEQYFD
jgi:hypothetical protein